MTLDLWETTVSDFGVRRSAFAGWEIEVWPDGKVHVDGPNGISIYLLDADFRVVRHDPYDRHTHEPLDIPYEVMRRILRERDRL
jgi:hypothetical protein